jgi:septal ring factor EnvC (AmiA/AmiB activator)
LQQGVDDDSLWFMEAAISPLPDDVEALKALVAAMARKANEAEAKLANAMAHQSAIEALIAHLKLQIAKLKREQFGPSAERSRRLLDQMERQRRPPRSPPSSASGPQGSRSPSTCRASASSCLRPVPARPAAAVGSPSLARTSPRPSRSSRARGR